MAGPRPNQAASAAQSQVPANSANSAATTDLQTDISSDIASVCDSWEASALASSLEHVVENVGLHFLGGGKEYPAPSAAEKDVEKVHPALRDARQAVARFFPSAETLDKLFAREHMGNYVVDRTTGRKFFEPMPLYVRIGMHLLFVSGENLVQRSKIQQILKNQSVREGKIYDATGPQVLKHINNFIATYQLDTSQLLEQDLTKYPTMNSFFARKLVPQARPVAAANDPSVIDSPADCRLSCFDTVKDATKFWVKGKQFTIPHLLGVVDDDVGKGFTPVGDHNASATSEEHVTRALADPKTGIQNNPKVTNNISISSEKQDQALSAFLRHRDYALAVARLAPQDYHRFHSPVDGVLVSQTDIDGDLYTVNPQAVNENLNVFTQNKRSVMMIDADLGPGLENTSTAFVAVGAMLVGSIVWSKKPGDRIRKGEELGYFQYGGSTCIVVFPGQCVKFNKDLATSSSEGMETLVKVGEEIGTAKRVA